MLAEMYRDLPQQFTAPACNCLWDVLFNRLGEKLYNYTSILSAYRAKYGITTKDQIYHRMINELDAWIDTINDQNDIITIALGMALNITIFDVFYKYCRVRNEDMFHKPANFYNNLLDELVKINFDATNLSIDYWHYINDMSLFINVKPYTPQLQQISDLQSVYESQITSLCRYLIHDMEYDSDDVSDIACNKGTIQYCIQILTIDVFGCYFIKTYCYLKKYGRLNNITDKWQILDHIKAAIGPYPKTLEHVLELYRTHRFKFYYMSGYYHNYYTIMMKSIDFDTIPIKLINIHFPIEHIPEYCSKLSKTYRRIKAAKHEDSY
jgi:hypothetical protein